MTSPRAGTENGASYSSPPVVEDFELLGEIGHGATSVVYRARRRTDGCEVALKVVRTTDAEEHDVAGRVEREARTAARLSHPNIVAVLDVRRLTDGRLALVMPLVRGRTLRDALRDSGQLPVMYVERILRDIAAALAHAHARGVVHLDVKPENIFLHAETGRALLADFGIARSLGSEHGVSGAAGTPTYMAPEQIEGGTVTGAADLYSLGLVAWEMLSGERPWMGEELNAILRKQRSDALPPLDALRPGVPDRLHFVVERLTRKSPADRWNSAEIFLREWGSATPKQGWRRWRVEQRVRAKAWNVTREHMMTDVAGFAERVGKQATQQDIPTLERIEIPAELRGASRRGRRWKIGLAVVLLVGVAGAGSVMFLRLRGSVGAPAAAIVPSPRRDSRAIEVPALPPAADSIVRSHSAMASDSLGRSAVAAPPTTIAGAAQPTVPALLDTGTRAPSPASPAPARDAARRGVAQSVDTARGETVGNRGEPLRRSASTIDGSTATPAPDRSEAAVTVEAPTLLSAGGRHSCAVWPTGAVGCWGANDDGALGDGTAISRMRPVLIADGRRTIDVSSGVAHSCSVTADGEAFCWGQNDRGQLGDGTTTSRSAPARVPTAMRFRTVHAGGAHSCALTSGGQVACWGSNAYGQVGSALTGTLTAPLVVTGFPGTAVVVSTGRLHTCALDGEGNAWCWGRGAAGQLGDGGTADRKAPVKVETPVRFIRIAAGGSHTCGIAIDGSAWCWGANESGQLGIGSPSAEPRRTPVRVESAELFVDVTAGTGHSCARTRNDAVLCWGQNIYGQLGDGSTIARPRPTAVLSSSRLVAVQASAAHTCALGVWGDRYCWGYNVDGQLGDGTRDNRLRPSRVGTPAP